MFSVGIAMTHHYATQVTLINESIINEIKSTSKGLTRKDGDSYTYTYYVGGNHWFNQRGGTAKVYLVEKWNQ